MDIVNNANRRRLVQAWQAASEVGLASAKRLYDAGDYRGASNRAYYSSYQASTASCIAHGDEVHFPQDWNNPTHDQLPDLIRNNGHLSLDARRQVSRDLVIMRRHRETADYKPGQALPKETALENIQRASTVLVLLRE